MGYRIVNNNDGRREYVFAVTELDVEICGAWRAHEQTGWTGYVTELVRSHTRLWITGHAQFVGRQTALSWVELIAALYAGATQDHFAIH